MSERDALVFERAAAIIQESDPAARLGCCEAIRLAGTPVRTWGEAHDLAIRFARLFYPSDDPTQWDTTSNWGRRWSDDLIEQLNCRVTALLIMAAIEDGKGDGRGILDGDDADVHLAESHVGTEPLGTDGGSSVGRAAQAFLGSAATTDGDEAVIEDDDDDHGQEPPYIIPSGPLAGKELRWADRTGVDAEEAAIDAMLNRLGLEVAFVSDSSRFTDFHPDVTQEMLDERFPVHIPIEATLLEGLAILRRSMPGWPDSRPQ